MNKEIITKCVNSRDNDLVEGQTTSENSTYMYEEWMSSRLRTVLTWEDTSSFLLASPPTSPSYES